MATRRCFLGFLLALAFTACSSNSTPVELEPEDVTPVWLTRLIVGMESKPVANPPASITRFEYKGEVVYYLPSRCCDIPSVLYDSAGAKICSPDGGITGRGDGRCSDFSREVTKKRIIWQDPRGKDRGEGRRL